MQWRELLRSFNHVKTIRVHGLFAERESLPEALPDLQVLECLVGCDASDTFATYVNVRKAAGYPIRLVLVDSSGHSPPNTSL